MKPSSNVLLQSAAGEPDLLGGRTLNFLTVAAALATSTSYVLQPELTTVAEDLHSTVPAVTVVAGAAVIGYLLGLALLVPLVDRYRSHVLVAGQLLGLSAGLLVAALAPNLIVLVFAMLLSGACASVGAQMSTLAGKHSPPEHRGKAVGTVTAGISAGILLGRIAGGALADAVGWSTMILIFAAACVVLSGAAFATLPRTPVTAAQSYAAVIRTLPTLILSHRRLRVSAVSGALWFFAFSLVWVSVSLALSLPPLNLPPTDVGLYSFAGILGILATRIAGTMSDRHGSPKIIMTGLALAMLCTIVMIFTLTVAPVLLAALALFDAGLFSAQVANQSRVLAMDPARPAQFNSAYMVVYFIGGSIGTAIGGTLTSGFGWPFAAATAGLAIVCAALINRSYDTATSSTRPAG